MNKIPTLYRTDMRILQTVLYRGKFTHTNRQPRGWGRQRWAWQQNALVRLTGYDPGFDYKASKSERDKAVKRWQDWLAGR